MEHIVSLSKRTPLRTALPAASSRDWSPAETKISKTEINKLITDLYNLDLMANFCSYHLVNLYCFSTSMVLDQLAKN